MKKLLLFMAVLGLPVLMMAQDAEKPKFGVKLSGFVRNDMVFNTRQVVSARGEGQFFLAPDPVSLDAEGNDINAAPNLNIIGINTRLRAKITGPDAFGAKTSGLIEGDFFGTNSTLKFAFRLRHAFFKLDWKSAQLLTGQYWHPMFATECFPGTVSFGAGVPFNPLARSPQIRFTKKFGDNIGIFASVMSQGHFKSKSDVDAHKNSAIPEAHLQFQFKNDLISAGLGINYQSLRPELVSSTGYINKETINSLSYFGYLKLKTKPLTAKVYAMYGQNNDNLVMMGGYGVKDMVYSPEQITKGFVEYTPYNTLSTWVDFETTGKKLKAGLFVGYALNLGAQDSVISSVNATTMAWDGSNYSGRWGNVNAMFRIAPRVTYMVNKVKLGFELEYSSIDYAQQERDANGAIVVGSDAGGVDAYGKVTNFETADNLKFVLSMAYIF